MSPKISSVHNSVSFLTLLAIDYTSFLIMLCIVNFSLPCVHFGRCLALKAVIFKTRFTHLVTDKIQPLWPEQRNKFCRMHVYQSYNSCVVIA